MYAEKLDIVFLFLYVPLHKNAPHPPSPSPMNSLISSLNLTDWARSRGCLCLLRTIIMRVTRARVRVRL